MPLTTSWLLDKRVIYLSITGAVSNADIEDILDAQYQQYVDGIGPVHMIIDLDPQTVIMPSLMQARQRAFGALNEKVGWTVVVNASTRLIPFTVSLLKQLNNIHEYKNARTVDEAVEFLTTNDPSLAFAVGTALDWADARIREA